MRAAVCGAINADWIGTPSGVFHPGDSNPGKVSMRMGGVGRNIAEALLRLGCQVQMVCGLGEEGTSGLIRHRAEALGIDMSLSRVIPGCVCGTYLCINDDQGNVAAAIADMDICDHMTPDFFAPVITELNQNDFVVLDANLPAETLAYLAREVTVSLCADPVSAEKAPRLKEALHRLTLLKPNAPEAEALTGIPIQKEADEEEAAAALVRAGVKHVFLSLGERGVLYANKEGFQRLSCMPGVVRNTNGCGDVFMASAARALLREGRMDGFAAARYGLAAAAINAESMEAVSPELSPEAVEKRMER